MLTIRRVGTPAIGREPAPPTANGHFARLQRNEDFVASFFAFFNAFFSFGVRAAFFLTSLFDLRSLDMSFIPQPWSHGAGVQFLKFLKLFAAS